MQRSRIKPNAARRNKTKLRTAGPVARRKFVRSLPCIGCGHRGHTQVAHVRNVRNSGTGYKPDAKHTVPLCGPHYVTPKLLLEGCHAKYDSEHKALFLEVTGLDMDREAEKVELMWQVYRRQK